MASKDSEMQKLLSVRAADQNAHMAEIDKIRTSFRDIENKLMKERKKSEKLSKERTAKNNELAKQFGAKELERE